MRTCLVGALAVGRCQLAADGRQVGRGLGNGGRLLLDLAAGVEDGRVVAVAEETADVRQRLTGVLSQQVHGDVARRRDALASALAAERPGGGRRSRSRRPR